MKIGIIGAADSVDKIYNILKEKYNWIEFVLEKEDKIENTLKIIENIKESVDGIYLTGIGIYYTLINDVKIELEKPVVYTKRGSIGLIKGFWEMFKENKFSMDRKLKIGRDIIEEEIFSEVIKEFDIKIEENYYQKYESGKTENEYLENYIKKFEAGEIECVFTAFGYIYNKLKEKKIPVYRLQATNIEIENELLSLLNKIENFENKRNNIGIEIIKLNFLNKELDNNLGKKLEIEKKLLEYSHEVEGNIQSSDDKEYIIISTIDILKNEENLRNILKLKKIIEEQQGTLIVGIGEGKTLFQAERNAKEALKVSLNQGGDIYFSDGEKIRGPLFSLKEFEYKKISDTKINNIAQEIGISPIYIEKIKGMIKKQKKDKFTSVEIAEILHITPRSVNRILKKIIEKNYAENVHLESSLTAGRPRRVIKFYF